MPMPPGSGTPMEKMGGVMWMPTAPPTVGRLLAIHLQPVPILPVFALLILAIYIWGILVLRRRGVRWPVQRTIWWTLGVVSILAVTATGVDGYGMELFSVHMVQHMMLGMLTPVFLVLGAPITLALRALPARHGGGWNARRVLLAVLHSRVAQALTHPVVTVSLFLLSLYGLYFTPIFDYLMSSMWGHNLMLLHFLAIGVLYFWGVMGVDPSPREATRGFRSISNPVVRMFELFVTIPFHAFFGIVVITSVDLIVHFYATPIPGWGIKPLADQQVGGGIAWGFTELPTLVVLGAIVYQWQRSEERHQRQNDRKADRDGDADLTEYNDYLAKLRSRSEGS